jgi:hypothetical protein
MPILLAALMPICRFLWPRLGLATADETPILCPAFRRPTRSLRPTGSLLVPTHHQLRWTLAAIALATGVCGCTPEVHRYIKFPQLFHPGPAGYQRAEAIEHDPYPLNDVAPPVVGGRPLAYQEGVPEVERTRLAAPPPPRTGPIFVPGMPAAPSAIGSPYPPPPGYPAAPPPVVTTPFSTAVPAQAAPFVQQQRSPY